jgi:acetyl-CoA C-acetyltransferase
MCCDVLLYGRRLIVVCPLLHCSFTKAANAWSSGAFLSEVVPVEVRDRRGGVTVVSEDETVKTAKFDKIPKLKPCFKSDGSVTAASSSPLSDGACALVLMSAARAEALKVKPLARIVSSADATQRPELFTTSPALAIPKAVAKAGLTLDDIRYFEINEAFAVVALANMKLLGLTADAQTKVNIMGGAVAIGHPLGKFFDRRCS